MTFEVVTFHGERSDTHGVMAYADHPAGKIPLGIDAHWHEHSDAEMALEHYRLGLAAHGRTTEQQHRVIARGRVTEDQIVDAINGTHPRDPINFVPASPREIAQWRRIRPGQSIPYRVACGSCGLRFWQGELHEHKEVS